MLKKNLLANYFGQGWTALMGFAFVPFYVKLLGIEAYGLIGLFAVLQSWLSLLDIGMTPTLGREMARFSGGERTIESIRDLLRSIEMIAILFAMLIATGVGFGAKWIALNWLRSNSISVETVSNAFVIMGFVTAIRFVENIYRSALIGMQKQVIYNLINGIMATLRGLGAVILLKWTSPTISIFFYWQGVLSILTLIILILVTYKFLPEGKRSGRFSYVEMKGVSKFASGILGITLLKIMLTQIDKVVLSKFLTLVEFGYYTLATTISSSLLLFVSPVVQAIYPKLCELNARGDIHSFAKKFHQASQLVSVIAGSLCITMIFFSNIFLELWTQDISLANKVSPLLIILSTGSLLNGLMWIPYQAQLAYKWTRLTFLINLTSVIVLIPTIILIVPIYGALGAAWIWVILNCGYLFISGALMFKNILITEKWEWYVKDNFIPLATATFVISILKMVIPPVSNMFYQFACLIFVFGLAFVVSGSVSKYIRVYFLRIINMFLVIVKNPLSKFK